MVKSSFAEERARCLSIAAVVKMVSICMSVCKLNDLPNIMMSVSIFSVSLANLMKYMIWRLHRSLDQDQSLAVSAYFRFDVVVKWETYACMLISQTQQTRDSEPMLVQCWADVVDGGPTLSQHWFTGSCLLGKGFTFELNSYINLFI